MRRKKLSISRQVSSTTPFDWNHQADCFIGNAGYFSAEKPAGLPRSTISPVCGRNKSPLLPHSPFFFFVSRISSRTIIAVKISEGSRGPGFSSTDFIYIPPQLVYLPLSSSLPSANYLSILLQLQFHSSPALRLLFRGPLSLSILLLFTAARFSVKTGRTRSKGCRVWRRRRQRNERIKEGKGCTG